MFTCDLCGQEFKTERGPSSNKHLKGKRHQNALRDRPVSQLSEDLCVFLAIKFAGVPNFSIIDSFTSSFGLKSTRVIQILFNQIKLRNIIVKAEKNPELLNIYEDLLTAPNIVYPLTLRFSEVVKVFRSLRFQNPQEAVKFFTDMENSIPNFVTLSSSKIGYPTDLLTFNRIFPSQVEFHLASRWII